MLSDEHLVVVGEDSVSANCCATPRGSVERFEEGDGPDFSELEAGEMCASQKAVLVCIALLLVCGIVYLLDFWGVIALPFL